MIESTFEVYYSMSCFNLIFYFSIMYKYLLNATVYKNKDDATVIIPMITVILPYIMCTFEYFTDTISYLDYTDYNNQNASLSLWPVCLLISIVYIFSNYLMSR